MGKYNIENLEKYIENVDKCAWTIANLLRGGVAPDDEHVICATYLGIIVRENEIKTEEELDEYINRMCSEDLVMFLLHYRPDFESIQEIASQFEKEMLVAVVLFLRSRDYIRNLPTPDSISSLALEILKIEGKTVADFGCGRGSFLINASNSKPVKMDAIEIDTVNKAISQIRASLLQFDIEVLQFNMLYLPEEKKYDCIFSNYPFGMRKKMLNIEPSVMTRLEMQVPEIKKVTSADWIYNLNIVNHLKEDGRAVVITTNGTTWNGLDKGIREYFVEKGLIEAIIALPAGIFPGTGIATTMMVLSHENKAIRMVDASAYGEKGRRQNILNQNDIDAIIQSINKDSETSRIISIDEIRECEYYLNPQRYLEAALIEDGIEFGTIIKNITRGAQIKASDLDDLVSNAPTDYQYLMLANIKDGFIDEELPYLKEIDSKLERYCIKNNSLILSKNGAPFKVAVAKVPENKRILANGNLYVIEIDEEKADVYFLEAFFKSETGNALLNKLAVGATLPNIPVDALKKALIPLPDPDEQKRIGQEYQIKEDEVKLLKYKLEKALNALKSIYEEA